MANAHRSDRHWLWAERIAASVLLLWLLVSFVELGGSVIHAYNRLPETDYWETVPHLDSYRHFPPAAFWEQHYEHRVAAGAGSILLFFALSYLAWRYKLIQEPAVLVPSAVVLLTMATALLTSLARIPVDRPFAQAVVTPGRYVNFGAHY
jgi:hypothetical protein